jgi:hypothetical protein
VETFIRKSSHMETIEPAPQGAKIPSSQSLKCEGFGAVDGLFVSHPRDAKGACKSLPVIARSPCDEAIQAVSADGFWIASAFAKASADKSLRSQ